MTNPALLAHQIDGVRWLTLNRPERRNALNAELIAALEDEVRRVESDDSLRSVVIRGAGPSFCAGGDFQAFLEAPSGSGPIEFLSDLANCFMRIERSSKPWIAALHGHAIAGGLELALVCDVVIAADDTLIGDGHVRNRLLPAGGSAVRLERAVGKGVARWMHLSGDYVTAADLKSTGWIHATTDESNLDDLARQIASRLASVDLGVQRRMKQLLIEVERSNPEDGLLAELRVFEDNWRASDVPAALRAFLADRPMARSTRSEEVA